MIRWHIISEEHYRLLGGGMFEPDEIIGEVPGPGLLVTEGDGIAMAVTAEELQAAAAETHAFCCIPGPAIFKKLMTALPRPADGADAHE